MSDENDRRHLTNALTRAGVPLRANASRYASTLPASETDTEDIQNTAVRRVLAWRSRSAPGDTRAIRDTGHAEALIRLAMRHAASNLATTLRRRLRGRRELTDEHAAPEHRDPIDERASRDEFLSNVPAVARNSITREMLRLLSDGCDITETAARLGITRDAVDSRLKRLRRRIDELGLGDER